MTNKWAKAASTPEEETFAQFVARIIGAVLGLALHVAWSSFAIWYFLGKAFKQYSIEFVPVVYVIWCVVLLVYLVLQVIKVEKKVNRD